MTTLFKHALGIMLALCGLAVQAHNNPTFREDLLATVEVAAQPTASGAFSPAFAVQWPEGTVQLIWRVRAPGGAERIRFSVRQADAVLLSDLGPGAQTHRISGDALVITGVTGTSQPFAVDVLAKVLDRSQGGQAEAGDVSPELSKTLAEGLAVYKRANCMGCHKWHGQGGGGYGGWALSLRATALNAENLTRAVRCGIPATGMPYHFREAYAEDDDKSCYGKTRAELGASLPPRTIQPLSAQQIDSVVTYVLHKIKGHGDPTFAECEAFWGPNKRQCDEMK